MNKKLIITMKDMKRYEVLKLVMERKLKGNEASQILGLSYVHISRLKKKLALEGFEGILRKVPEFAPNKKISNEKIKEIINLRKEIYYDFNVNHFTDKLHEVHNIPYSYSSIKQILIKAGLHTPRKKKIVHRQRRRMPKAGMLIQMDSSLHQWLANIPEKWWLIAMIDDATNEVPYAFFFPKDTLFANMHVIRKFIEIKGVFLALYADKASHFTTTRHGGIHYNVNPEQDDTQIERALDELDITFISANSCQAKGRIEVRFKLFQDRLIKEMRVAGIKDYNHANKFLIETFLPWHNVKYTLKTESVYRQVPVDKNLNTIFCIKKDRTVKADNTIQVQGETIQIPPSNLHLSFANRIVQVCILEDNRIIILYKDKIIHECKLSKNNKILKKEKKIENLLNLRDYFIIEKNQSIPSKDHPWRKSFDKWIKLAQAKKSVLENSYTKEMDNVLFEPVKNN